MTFIIRGLVRLVVFLIIAVVVVLAGFRGYSWWQETESAAALVPANSLFVETEMGVMHASVWGDQAGIPVVMTHGMAAWGGLWEETAKVLATNGYRVIAIDLPPFGFSGRESPDFSRTAQAARLNALAQALALDDYLLVGHSYGGGVALEAALRYPDRIAGLVLVCAVTRLSEPGQVPGVSPVPFVLNYDFVAQPLVSATITNPLLTGTLIQRFMHRKESLTDRHVEILQRPIKLKGNASHMVEWLRQFLASDPNALSRDRENLKTLTVPVSLIWGEQDTVTPISQGEDLSALMNPVSFKRLDDTGHMPQLESPKIFVPHLLQALQDVRNTGG